MNRHWPVPIRAFDEIWTIANKEEFAYELGKFIAHKRHARKLPLSETEHVFGILSDMQSWIEMEGFHDLFYQAYNLSDCLLVEKTMRELGTEQLANLFAEAKHIYLRHKLANLFAEAKHIYLRHKTDITEEEFRKLEPFDLPEGDGARFDEIAKEFYGSDSQLFELGDRLADFARKHRAEFYP
jgi:hypothetical protein